jgi:hypothetical protein
LTPVYESAVGDWQCCCGDHLEAARAGHLACQQRLLREAGCFPAPDSPDHEPVDKATMAQLLDAANEAAERGHAGCLEVLLPYIPRGGFLREKIARAAVKGDHLECLRVMLRYY